MKIKMRSIVRLIGVLKISILCFILTACSNGYTHEINQVEIGMSKQQVIKVLGYPDSTSASGNETRYTYELQQRYGASYFPYDISFINNRVTQFGMGAVGGASHEITIFID